MRVRRLRSRFPWAVITVTVVVLIGVGVGLIATASPGEAGRDLGVSLASGGVTGLVFVFVQSIMTRSDERHRLLLQLSSSQDLTGIDLRRRHLPRITLIGKKMAVSDLDGAVLRSSRLIGTDLTWSTIRRADLTGSVLAYANLTDSDLRGSKLRYVDLRNVNFDNARLADAVFDLADLSGAMLERALFDGVRLGRICYDDATTWPPGFEPPPDDPSVREMHRDRPDWHAFWAKRDRIYT